VQRSGRGWPGRPQRQVRQAAADRLAAIDAQALEAYLAIRAKHPAKGNDLFVTIRGRAPHKVRATSCSSGWPGFSDIVERPVRQACDSTICGILSLCAR
jgi:hypothetical protein